MSPYLKNIILTGLVAISLSYSSAQEATPTLYIKKANQAIKLDGILDDVAWSSCSKATNFRMNYPSDTQTAASKTEVYVTYSDSNYLAL